MTKIEWAHAGLGRGKTWNPIRARDRRTRAQGWHCEKVSPACANCYAERWNQRPGIGGTGLAYKPGHRADVEHYLDEQTLLAPLHWTKPTGIFVCSMTDAFGDWVETEWLDKIFAIAALCPQHVLIFLTKRSGRMREYITSNFRKAKVFFHLRSLASAARSKIDWDHIDNLGFPLPNIWLGVTAEDQQRADERRDDLRALAKQGWTTIVSYESALGPVDWAGWRFVSQIICGGESGPNARPMHPDWARATRDFCETHKIAFFFKQWGEFFPADQISSSEQIKAKGDMGRALRDGHAIDLGDQWTWRIGKTHAGRLLDGREHNDFPDYERRRSI